MKVLKHWRKLKRGFDLVEFIVLQLMKENFKNYFKHLPSLKTDDELTILANGPSLKQDLPKLVERARKGELKDCCAVNYIGESDHYNVLRPKYYVLSDEQFFSPQHAAGIRGAQLLKILNEKTTWEMQLFVPYVYTYNNPDFHRIFTNKKIQIVPFHTQLYMGFECFRNFIYDHGWGNGEFNTVVLNAEYIALRLHYTTLHLYGVDHTFFNGLMVDAQNKLNQVYTHYYDNGSEQQARPIVNGTSGKAATMVDFLEWNTLVFKGHVIMNRYAQHCEARIINHTKGSLIDAYEREE